MKVIVNSTRPYDRQFMEAANKEFGHELTFIEARLSKETAALAKGHPAVCIFVNDIADNEDLQELKVSGACLLAMRPCLPPRCRRE